MIQSLYAGSTGMEAQQLNLNTIANNLANANTTGFKASKIEFQDLLYQKPRTAGADVGNGNVLPTGVELGHGARVVATAKVFTQGRSKQTGGSLDVAIDGDGFLKATRTDGTDVFTRDGALKIDAQGRVVTSDGLVVTGFPNLTKAQNIGISPAGKISWTVDGKANSGDIQLYVFANPAGLRSLGGNLYEETVASGANETRIPGLQGAGTLIQDFWKVRTSTLWKKW